MDNLGKRILDSRKDIRMTQKELAGECISRNMLSLIESGRALPSLSTLLYLCEKLNTTPNNLLSTDETHHELQNKSLFEEALELYSRGDDAECVRLCLTAEDKNFAVTRLLILSSTRHGLRLWKEGHLRKCDEAFAISLKEMDKAPKEEFPEKEICAFYRLLIAQDWDQAIDPSLFEKYASFADFRNYLTLKNRIESGDDVTEQELSFLPSGVYRQALQNLILSKNSPSEAIGAIRAHAIRSSGHWYLVSEDMKLIENILTETESYKKAYEIAKARLELRKQFDS